MKCYFAGKNCPHFHALPNCNQSWSGLPWCRQQAGRRISQITLICFYKYNCSLNCFFEGNITTKCCLQNSYLLRRIRRLQILQNSLLIDPVKFVAYRSCRLGTYRTGDSDQALASNVLLAFDTATTYQVIASSLWFKAKKVVNISSTHTHTQKKKICVIPDLRNMYWVITSAVFTICCNSSPTIA